MKMLSKEEKWEEKSTTNIKIYYFWDDTSMQS